MNTEDKAKELVDKFSPHADWNNEYGSSERQANIKHAKQCAIICCEEIIDQWEYIDTYLADMKGELNPNLKYWHEVKEHIQNLK